MADPFQNVSAAGAEFIETIAKGLEARAADPSMLPIIVAYLDLIHWGDVHHAIEIGSGTGPIARMIADRAPRAQVTGVEPSPELVSHAESLKGDRPNLSFETGDGAALRHAGGSFDLAVQHTVLSHVTDRQPSSPRRTASSVRAAAGRLRRRFRQGQPGDRIVRPAACGGAALRRELRDRSVPDRQAPGDEPGGGVRDQRLPRRQPPADQQSPDDHLGQAER